MLLMYFGVGLAAGGSADILFHVPGYNTLTNTLLEALYAGTGGTLVSKLMGGRTLVDSLFLGGATFGGSMLGQTIVQYIYYSA